MDTNKLIYYMKDVENVINRLGDQESRELYELRFNYIMKNDIDEFVDGLMRISNIFHRVFKIRDLERMFSHMEKIDGIAGRNIIIWGSGPTGKRVEKVLSTANYNVIAFVDNNSMRQGYDVKGIPIISPEDFMEFYKGNRNCILAIATLDAQNFKAIYAQVLLMGFPREWVYWQPTYLFVPHGFFGEQYFDLEFLEKDDEEVFIDGGCLDGTTSFQFINWCGGDYKKIYAFEPNKWDYEKCKKIFSETRDVELYNLGLWHQKSNLGFTEHEIRGSSRIDEQGDIKIEVVGIDEVLKGERVTFIKMDIEGSELEALKGAENTIKNFKPKLAISLYHKKEDLFEIPAYLLEIQPEYKFYIRHYTTTTDETVLYAI